MQGPFLGDMVNISLREHSQIQLIGLKLVLPLSFARLEFKVYGLEFKVCQGQYFFKLAVIGIMRAINTILITTA